jgi:hypothetical protein
MERGFGLCFFFWLVEYRFAYCWYNLLGRANCIKSNGLLRKKEVGVRKVWSGSKQAVSGGIFWRGGTTRRVFLI